jgi:hypothetical protein
MLAARRMFGDDRMSRVVPDAVAVGAALFEDGVLDEPAVAATPDVAPSALRRGRPASMCRKWTRPARAIARRLIASRLLSRHWRGPADDTPGATWTAIDRVPAIRRLAGDRSVLVFSVPLLDESGAVVEHHVVPLCVEDHTRVDSARALAKNALEARAARLTVRLRRRLHDRVEAEHALASRVLTGLNPRDAQPGLFDQRELHEFETARAEAALHRLRLADRHSGWERETDVKVGRPVLELAFLARR